MNTMTAANGDVLNVDRDGDPYRMNGTTPWKVTHCCGAFVTCDQNGIPCCKVCWHDADIIDGPANVELAVMKEN